MNLVVGCGSGVKLTYKAVKKINKIQSIYNLQYLVDIHKKVSNEL
jgi:hypothetical protein